jgi:hypothetical protein
MISRNSRTSVLPVLLAVAMLALPAYSSTITTYTTASSWQIALSNFQTIDFGGLAPANSFTNYIGGFTVNGVQFLGINGPQLVVLDTAFQSWYDFGTGDAAAIQTTRANSSAPVPYIHVILPAPVTAVGFNIFSVGPTALPYNVSLPIGQYIASTSPRPSPAFWGITSDVPFSTLDLTLQGSIYNDGTYAFVDNFSFGTAQPLGQAGEVPESSTSLLFGAGLTALGLLRRRNKPGVQK